MPFVYVLSSVVSDGGPDIVLATHSERPFLVYSLCVMFWSKDFCSSYRPLTHGHFGFKSLEVSVLDWGNVNKRRRKKERKREK